MQSQTKLKDTSPILLVLALLLPVSLHAVETVSNAVYEVHVQDQSSATSDAPIGSWNVITGPDHDAGAGFDILYRGTRVDTNFSSLRVFRPNGNVDYVFGGGEKGNLNGFVSGDGPSPLAPTGRGWRTTWEITPEQLTMVQDVIVVGAGSSDSAVYHTVEIRNNSRRAVRLGLRHLYDWSLFGTRGTTSDGPGNQLESVCGRVSQPLTTTEFLHSPATAQVVRVSLADSEYEPLLGLNFDPGLASGLEGEAPDEYAFVSWRIASPTDFDYQVGNRSVIDSAGLVWFGRDAARAHELRPGEAKRFTQVLFATFPGECHEACAQAREETLLCTTDGSGDFTYDFRFVNRLEGEDIHQLFFLNPPDGVSFEPNHVSFDIPVRFGGTRLIPPIRIKGAQAGQAITFLMTMHDEFLEECCAVEVTIQMPECDCGQVVEDTPPRCTFFPLFGPARKDTFTFQNLLGDEEIDHLVLKPLTPESVQLVPNHFDLTDAPLGFGDTVERMVTIQGAAPGDEVCYLISSHDEAFEDCCSIERCVRLPRCIIDPEEDYHEFDGTTVIFSEMGAQVLPDTPGQPAGVSIDVPSAVSFDAVWQARRSDELPVGAEIRTTFRGTHLDRQDQPLAVLTTRRTDSGFEVGADFSGLGAAQQSVHFFREGRFVGNGPILPGGGGFLPIGTEVCRLSQTDSHLRVYDPVLEPPLGLFLDDCFPEYPFFPVFPFAMPGQFQCIGVVATYSEVCEIEFGGAVFTFDEIRFTTLDETASLGPVETVELQASSGFELNLTSIDADVDCNRNNTPDFQDLLLGVSVDTNHDGIPDECEVDTLSLLILNTGFEATGGELLSPGSQDDDWHVVQTGEPALIVRNPLSSWTTPLPDSAWVSVEPERGVSQPGLSVYELERCFCLDGTEGEVELNLELFVDDRATVRLNGALLEGPGGSFRGPDPFEVRAAGTVGDGLFESGVNCLAVEVDDFGGVVTGLDLVGTVRAEDGFCLDTSP